jgi:predicted subunit of tRNA(5-methylaminomethyl-2-thiouridylate) methyltransferase
MNDQTVLQIFGFLVLLVTLVSGIVSIKKNINDSNALTTASHVALEHRLTVLEESIKWIKEHIPAMQRRQSDKGD